MINYFMLKCCYFQMQILKEYGKVQGLMYVLLLSMSASLTKTLGMAPGGEFRRANDEAKEIPGCLVQLGDRPIHITLKRALATLSTWQKIKLAFNVLTSSDKITPEEVEKMKQKDLLESLLEEMAGEFDIFFLQNYLQLSSKSGLKMEN